MKITLNKHRRIAGFAGLLGSAGGGSSVGGLASGAGQGAAMGTAASSVGATSGAFGAGGAPGALAATAGAVGSQPGIGGLAGLLQKPATTIFGPGQFSSVLDPILSQNIAQQINNGPPKGQAGQGFPATSLDLTALMMR